MSNWAYVTIAFTLVWGSLVIYALLLARRVAQARDVAQRLQETSEKDATACDVPSAT